MTTTRQINKVVVTGIGMITPLGCETEQVWTALLNGSCGIKTITSFDITDFPIAVGGEILDFDPLAYMDIKKVDRTGRSAQFAIAATKQALNMANIDLAAEDPDRIGILIGTSGMPELLGEQMMIMKEKGPNRVNPLVVSRFRASMAPSHVGMELGVHGINTSINSACSSGNDAIGNAMNHLRLGTADIIIAGGTGSNITPIALATTNRIGALSKVRDPMAACLPFDAARSGFVYGDGACMLVLETEAHALARKAPILAEIAGAGWSFDAFSETNPALEPRISCMKWAIKDADITPSDIDYINAHGTGTKQNDFIETEAIKKLFGTEDIPPISSTKAATGHLGCAAGAVETAFCVLAIRDGIIPPTIHYSTPDPQCDLDYVPNTARRKTIDLCLNNSSGLGGQNCSLIIRRYKNG
jgi:3-oxoacyl-[acyl-carrier-protein] synthase II